MALLSPSMPTWRTLDEAAKATGISRRQLQRWIAAGNLTAYKRGGDRHVYVDIDDVRDLQKYRPLPRGPQRRRGRSAP